ncbi:hypothetical protein [Brevibacillus sp. NRS-1366]|uniref:hypothetical protein n=1 Tax=Brevibacillus sp. NRS-1366 TaxID=3233899 RepID=UPI003D1D72E1
MRADKLFIFLHLPKTAGTSMNTLLVNQFEREHVAFLHEGNPWSTERLVQLCNEESSPIQVISGISTKVAYYGLLVCQAPENPPWQMK